ncbi:MAG: hypothetical protein GEU82_09005 [Luteitalea sp.]|nr:hypothetical protein [Luteitalea sp.]
MQRHRFASLETLTVVTALAAIAVTPLAAQTRSATKAPIATTIPRTAWGAPDLTGIWTGNTMTPLERRAEHAGKQFLTKDEIAAIEKEQAVTALEDTAPAAGDPGTYNNIWTDPAYRWVPDRRTSLIVDPADGRIPYTQKGRDIQAYVRAQRGNGPYNTAADMDTGERCLTDGLPIYFSGYNNNYQIFQTKDHVAILHEYFHETRIVPLDGRPGGTTPQWLGNSRGHWEGDTLVVETDGIAEKGQYIWAAAWRGSRATARLVERFTRTADSIEYSFTLEDPTMFTRPWTAKWPLSRQSEIGVTQGPLYEYACHEGNHAMRGVLAGARLQEKEAAAAKR